VFGGVQAVVAVWNAVWQSHRAAAVCRKEVRQPSNFVFVHPVTLDEWPFGPASGQGETMRSNPNDLVQVALAVTAVFILIVVSCRLMNRYRWRALRLRLLTGTGPQRAALRVALAPVLHEFLPLLERAGQEVRAIVVAPTLSGSDGEPLAAEVEQLAGSSAFIVRLAHRVGSTLRQPDEVAGVLAEDLLYLYRHAAAVSVVRQTAPAASTEAAIHSATLRRPAGRNGLATLPRDAAQNEAEETVIAFKPNPLGPRNGQSS